MLVKSAHITDLLIKMFDNVAEAIVFFDREGNVIAMNDAAEQIMEPAVLEQMALGNPHAICLSCRGYTTEQELKTCLSCYIANPQDDFSSFQVYLNTRESGVLPYAASFQTVDEEQGIRVFLLRDLTKQLRTQEALNEKRMMKSVIKAQEDERKRISRELHDGVLQEMLSAIVDLRVLKYLDVSGEALEKIRQTEGSLMRLLEDIRHLSVELRPATLDDLGLEAAFRTHFKWIEQNFGIAVQFNEELEAKRYEDEIETVVYRVCQEAVFNALKYAHVDTLTVRSYEHDGKLTLKVVDFGVGFDTSFGNIQGTGLGLYGMKERAELVGGQLIVQSQVGKGTTILLEIPLSEATE